MEKIKLLQWCNLECKKIDKRVNNRKLSELSAKEVPHILKVFDL